LTKATTRNRIKRIDIQLTWSRLVIN